MGCGSSASAGVVDPTKAPAPAPAAGAAAAAANKAADSKAAFVPVTPLPANNNKPGATPATGTGAGSGLPGLGGGGGGAPASDLTALMHDAMGVGATPKPPGGPGSAPLTTTAAATAAVSMQPLPEASVSAAAPAPAPAPARAAIAAAGGAVATSPIAAAVPAGPNAPLTAEQFAEGLRDALRAVLQSPGGNAPALSAPAGANAALDVVECVVSYTASEYRIAVFTEDSANTAFIYRFSWAPPPLVLQQVVSPPATPSANATPSSNSANGHANGGDLSTPPSPRYSPAPVLVSHSIEHAFPAYDPPIADADHQPYPLLTAVPLSGERVACLCSNGSNVQIWDARTATRLAVLPPPNTVALTAPAAAQPAGATASAGVGAPAANGASQPETKANGGTGTGTGAGADSGLVSPTARSKRGAVTSGRMALAVPDAVVVKQQPLAVVTSMLSLPRQNRLVLAFVGGAIQFFSTDPSGAGAGAGNPTASPTAPKGYSLIEDMTIHARTSGRASGSGGIGAVTTKSGVVQSVELVPAQATQMALGDPHGVRISAMAWLAGSHQHQHHLPGGGDAHSHLPLTTSERSTRAPKDTVDPRLAWIDSFDHLRAWNTRTKRLVYTARVPGIWPHALVALKNHRLAIATDEVIRLYNTELRITPMTYRLTGHTKKVVALAVMPDGVRLISGAADATVRVWDTARAYKATAVLEGHTDTVLQVVPLDAERIASFSADQTVRIWDLATSSCVLTLQCPQPRTMTQVR